MSEEAPNIITETTQETPLILNTEDINNSEEEKSLSNVSEKEEKQEKKKMKKSKSKKKLHKLKSEKSVSPTSKSTENKLNTYEENIVERKERVPNEIRKYDYIYSPRTTYSKNKLLEDKLFQELSIGFDPITIKIVKSHFKERLGSLTKFEFISICKNHLLSWHPEIPNRKNILIQLLDRLFNEIDLNDNEQMEWDEFTNYIINNYNNSNTANLLYSLRSYSISKNTIDTSDFTENISIAFYIEKFNLIGLVQEGKSIIDFYDGNTCKKVKAQIDIRETQKEINELEIIELNNKAKELIIKENEEKKLKRKLHMEYVNKLKMNLNKSTSVNSESNLNNNNNSLSLMQSKISRNNNNKKEKIEKNNTTPEKLKKELLRINGENLENINKTINKKLTVLTTEFIPEYDTLLVSSSNNKISAWKYFEGEFKNVNKISKNIIDKNNFSCAILNTENPQNTMTWDPMQKHLYTGQTDGKILKWDLTKSKNLEGEIFDFSIAKNKHDKEMKYGKEKIAVQTKTIVSNNNNSNNNTNQQSNRNQKKINEENVRGEKLLSIMKKENMNRQSVSCIQILGKLQLLAAGYYNGNVLLWDTMLKDYRKYYTDQDTCIYQIEYDSNKNLLFTCGFSHEIYIYDPYIDFNAIYKLVGHNWSINAIAINSADEELVSIDILGNIKLWDINSFYNFQTINLNESYTDKKVQQDINNSKKKKISSNLKMIFLTKIKKILTYGDKLMVLESDTALNPNLADDQLILGCYYNPRFYEFVTICLKKIKIWNAFNGKVSKVYDNLMENNEITCYITDSSLKRIYIGDNLGKIKNFNMNTGSYIKDFKPHDLEILQLIHSDKFQMLISLSSDKIIKFQEDKALFETDLLKEIDMKISNVSTLALTEEFNRLIIGSHNGSVKFFDVHHLRFDSEVENEKDKLYRGDSINAILPIPGIKVVITAHESAKNKFVIIPPSGFKYHQFGHFQNKINKETYETLSCILSMDYDKENKKLFTGDQFGYIHCYNLKGIFDILNGSEFTVDLLQKLDEFQISIDYVIYAHKEAIKKLVFPNFKPYIIISTSTDRKCKIFKSENGEFIDELRQIASKFKDVPIGIKYYFADPFESKRLKDDPVETGVIYRKDLDKGKGLITKGMINKIRQENPQILNYSKAITAANAKERLYLETKNCDLEPNKSNKWNLNIDLDFIKKKEEEEFNGIYHNTMLNEEEIEKTSKLMQSQPIYSDNYTPVFINDMSEEKVKEFSSILSQKLRHVKLAMAKIKMEKGKYEDFQRETIRKKSINLKNTMAMLNLDEKKKNKNKTVYDKFAKKRAEMFGINTRVIKNPFDRFSYFKEDVDKSLNDLEFAIEERINKKYLKPLRSNRLVLPKLRFAKTDAFQTEGNKILEKDEFVKSKKQKNNKSDIDKIIKK